MSCFNCSYFKSYLGGSITEKTFVATNVLYDWKKKYLPVFPHAEHSCTFVVEIPRRHMDVIVIFPLNIKPKPNTKTLFCEHVPKCILL